MSFRVLGSVEAWAGESRLALGGRRQVALLAFFLVNANRPVSSDALNDGVWGAERAGAEKRLQMAVARLRKVLEPLNEGGEPVLRTVTGGYVLAVASKELDAAVFEGAVREGREALAAGEPERAAGLLADALGLWRGPPLAEVAFEDFAQPEIRRLEELHVAALEAHAEAELELGHHEELVVELEGLFAEHPTRERLAGQLMLALYRSGRQAEALDVYQLHRARLADELGLEPDRALKDLQKDVLEQSPSLDPSPAGKRGDARGRPSLPSGTVTFVFTDVEGSTRLLRELGSERYGEALTDYRERVRDAVAAHRGVELGTEGDGFFLAFVRASDALGAADALQAALADQRMQVRVGIHTGEPLVLDGDYVGLDVHKAARICDAAHGGQVLVSQAARDLAGDGLRELGEFRLKDLTAPERLYQLGAVEFPPLRTLRPTNLPVQPGPLLGRREELAELMALCETNRLVTLTGPGGSGKTRLALQLAGELSDQYRDGVWWVPLAAVTDPGSVPATIAQSLGARGELREHLAGKRVLLLLDNLEQVLDCAPLVAELLGALGELSMIATSRERLAISFEQEYPVPPLDEAAAEELFAARARQVKPGFEADAAVAEICRRLDRLPLALELASTRVKLMSTSQMLDRLERRLDLLGKGRRDAPDRQATMRATIGWSYDLLLEREQALFRQLGVFAGSLHLEAAEAVCDADLDALQSLVDKSLLRHAAHDRFFLLELTREYALEQLHAASETEQLARRHAHWFLQLAKRADEHLRSAEQGVWIARLEAETDNFRAALTWCSEHDPAGAIELATTLESPWKMHGRHRELIPWLERALTTPAPVDTHTRSTGLRTLVAALWFTNQLDRLREPLEESLALCRELGDTSGEASALLILGGTFWARGSIPKAIELEEAALGIWRDAGDRDGVERATNWLAGLYIAAGDPERGAIMYQDALAMNKESGDYGAMAINLSGLGEAELAKRDPENAARHFRESLRMSSDLCDERTEMYDVAGLACAAALQRDPYSAGRLWGIVEAAENRPGMAMVSGERALYARIITPLENDPAFQAGYEAGHDIELAKAVRELCANPTPTD
jgi:predicted ATPase/DNA-binding SARP family transcriptional activator